MVRHFAAPALWMFLLAAPALSQEGTLQIIDCGFTTECFGTDGCSDTEYALELRYERDPAKTAEPFTVKVSDVAEEFRAAPITDGSYGAAMTGFVSMNGSTIQRLFTVSGEIGRYSIHMPSDGIAIYYQGSCTERMR